MKHLSRIGLFAVAVATVLCAACSGGGGNVGPSAASSPGQNRQTTGTATFTVRWPTLQAQSRSHRKRNYLSPSTASISISVDGGTPIVVNNPTLASGSAGGTDTTTTTNIGAPVGSDTFAVRAYDAANAGGQLLAQNQIPYTIVAGVINSINVTLNGNLAKIACNAVAPYVTSNGTATPAAFTMVGPAGQIAIEPQDADGNIIVAPGVVPSLTLNGPAGQAATSTTGSNVFTVNVQVTATAVPLTASGTNLAGTAVTSTCDVTRVLAMYVVNHGQDGANPSVAIYPTSATSASTPTATIVGSSTGQVQTQFIAVANTGQIYLSNNGPMPGATFSPTSGYVNVYAPGASGNVAPASVIAGINQPTGLTFDTSGNLFLVTAQTVNEYAPGATGSSTPSNVLNYSALAADCYGDDVDVNGLLYVACATNIFVYAKGATGTAAPTQNITLNTSETDYFPSWLGVTANSTSGTAGSIYAPTFNNNQSQVDEFAAGSNSTSVPTIITGTEISSPLDIFMDSTGAFYLTNYATSTVGIFTSATTLGTGLATQSITNGISYPYGVTVE